MMRRRQAIKILVTTAVSVICFTTFLSRLFHALSLSSQTVNKDSSLKYKLLKETLTPRKALSSNNTRNLPLTTSKSGSTLETSVEAIDRTLFKIDFDENRANYTEFWNKIQGLAGKDCLYPKDYDATQVTQILQKGTIVRADLFKQCTSLKFKLTFEGQQSAIFKVKLTKKMNRSKSCNTGCEHPEYEVAAYTLNRMFDLRNMPYATGRVLSWSELEPVASKELLDFVQMQDDHSICFNWTCTHQPTKKYCLEKGKIPGAVIYFIEDKNIDFMRSQGGKNIYHGYYNGVARTKDIYRLPGDKTFCREFREDPRYKEDRWFLDLVDIAVFDYMMSHRDAKHTYLAQPGTESEPEYNVMIDFGHAFCKTDDLVNLAPLTQCCRMRSRLFQAMDQYRDSLEETFLALTKDDPLHPLILPEVMLDVTKKFKQILALIEFCRNLDGDSEVFIDV